MESVQTVEVPLMAWERPTQAPDEILAEATLQDVAEAILDEAPSAIRADQAAAGDDVEDAEEAAEEDAEDEAEESDDESEDAEDDELEADAEDVKTWKVKVDGQELEVDEGELIRGYQTAAHNTRKSQELARERQEVTTQREVGRQAIEALAQYTEAFQTHLQQTLPPEQFEVVRQQYQQMRQVQELDQAKQLAEKLEEEREALKYAIPEWRDEKVLSADREMMMNYANSLGFSEDDVASAVDHRLFVLLRDAARWRDLETNGKARIDAKLARPLQPGARSTQSAQAGRTKSKQAAIQSARQKAQRTGSDADWARVLELQME